MLKFLLFFLLFSCFQKHSVSIVKEPKSKVAKNQLANMNNAIFAATINQGKHSWFFKLNGHKEKVIKDKENFLNFVKTLKMKKGQLVWKVNENWERLIPKNKVHKYLFRLNNGSELSISQLPYSNILNNVNRWRKQINQPPITLNTLREQLQLIQLGNITVHYIEII